MCSVFLSRILLVLLNNADHFTELAGKREHEFPRLFSHCSWLLSPRYCLPVLQSITSQNLKPLFSLKQRIPFFFESLVLSGLSVLLSFGIPNFLQDFLYFPFPHNGMFFTLHLQHSLIFKKLRGQALTSSSQFLDHLHRPSTTTFVCRTRPLASDNDILSCSRFLSTDSNIICRRSFGRIRESVGSFVFSLDVAASLSTFYSQSSGRKISKTVLSGTSIFSNFL